MGTLTKLGISNNDIRAEGGKALAEAIRGNQVITELNIASNNLGINVNFNVEMAGVASLAAVIPGMGALAKFVFSGDDNSKSVTMETTMTVADFSGKGLGASGAIMLSAFLPKCL
jgi:hypothetical protein